MMQPRKIRARPIGSEIIAPKATARRPAVTSAPLSPIKPVQPEVLAAQQLAVEQARQRATQATAAKRPAPAVRVQPEPLHKDFQPPEEPEPKRNFFRRLQMPVIIMLGVVGGFLVQSPAVGQVVICVYGVLALLFRIDSRTTFMLAFLSIASTVLLVILQHESLLGQTFAGYTLLLFLIGVLCAAREVRAQKSLLSKKRGAARRY